MRDLPLLNSQHALVTELAALKANVDDAKRAVEKAQSRLEALQTEYDEKAAAYRDDMRACLRELLEVFPQDRALLRDLSL